MAENRKARAVGFNHVALEVGDIEEALAFYGSLFDFTLRSKSETMAFIDLGDQFINFSKGRRQAPDDERHLGLVVDDKELARQTLEEMGVPILPGPFLDFLDPWGNRIEIIGYMNIQLTKAPTYCAAWGWKGWRRTKRRWTSWPKRAWRRTRPERQRSAISRRMATPSAVPRRLVAHVGVDRASTIGYATGTLN